MVWPIKWNEILHSITIWNQTRPDTRPPVADRWAGADMRVFLFFDSCWQTYGRTDGPKDGRMDTASYRVAYPQLKMSQYNSVESTIFFLFKKVYGKWFFFNCYMILHPNIKQKSRETHCYVIAAAFFRVKTISAITDSSNTSNESSNSPFATKSFIHERCCGIMSRESTGMLFLN